MNRSSTFNALMPHLESSYNHFFNTETTSYSSWLKYKVLAIFECIPIIGRIVLIVEKFLYPSIEPARPLTEKTVEPVALLQTPTEEGSPIDPKIENPLALSAEEVALCAQGIFTGIGALTGFSYLKFANPYVAYLLQSDTYVTPTTPFGAIFAGTFALYSTTQMLMASSEENLKEAQKKNSLSLLSTFGLTLAGQAIAPAPIRVGIQGALSSYQISQAISGIKACITQIGTADTTTILRNLAIHSINIATSGYNFVTKATAIVPELNYYASWGLSHVVSEEYGEKIMGESCRGYFHPQEPKIPLQPLFKDYSSKWFPRVRFALATGSQLYFKNLEWLSIPVKSYC